LQPSTLVEVYPNIRRITSSSQREIPATRYSTCRKAIKITVTSEQGKEAILSILEAGEFFGEGCLIGEPTRHLAATSLVVSAVMRIEKAEMIRVLHDQSSFAEKFTAHLLTRKARIEGDLADQLFNSSEKRLARTLLLLANFGKDNRPEQISIKVSQETLAEMVGTTRPASITS
jgi:CRP-like cAMP-binding protein